MGYEALKTKVSEHIQATGMLNNPNIPLFVAVSGGMDSVCLFYTLKEILRKERLHVVHVNHCLRGEESDADQCGSPHETARSPPDTA